MTEKVRQRRKVEPKKGKKPNAEEGYIWRSRTRYESGTQIKEEVEQEQIQVPDFAGVEPARVRLGGGLTKNLGDFNSAKVEVMIELPCLPEQSEIKRVVAMLSEELDRVIPQEMDKNIGKEED